MSETRRTHKKSRTGCLVCKVRRVKCDEARPQCGKCAIGGRACSYAKGQTPGSAGSASSEIPLARGFLNPDLSALTGSLAAQVERVVGEQNLDADRPSGHFTAFHMALLFLASTEHNGFMPALKYSRLFISKALDAAHDSPYYLEQILALAALHLSTIHPDNTAVFRQQATALQNRALTMFNSCTDPPVDNLEVNFMFTSLVSLQVLYETLVDHMSSIGDFLGAFVNYTRIHRGVSAVISTGWEDLLNSDVGPMLRSSKSMATNDTDASWGSETRKLRVKLEGVSTETGMSSGSKMYLEALQTTQRLIDFGKANLAVADSGINAVTAWAVLVSEEYVNALYQHRPEALAIMAFYGAMLHKNRHYWVFADHGAALVQMIVAHVGPFWADTLAWPVQVISGEEDTAEAANTMASRDGSSMNTPLST